MDNSWIVEYSFVIQILKLLIRYTTLPAGDLLQGSALNKFHRVIWSYNAFMPLLGCR